MQTEDSEIITLMTDPARSSRGFTLLMQKYQERIYFLIRRIVLTHEDTEDVLQNTMLRIFNAIGGFRQDASLFTWMYRIAVNEALSFKRSKSKRHQPASGDEAAYLLESLKADDYFDGDEIQTMLTVGIDSLPVKQKLVFQLRYFEEMPYREMSEVLETSEGALKASYHIAVQKLLEFFNKK